MENPIKDTSLPPSAAAGRDTAMDLLRVLASALVVLIHVASQNWYTLQPDNIDWQFMNIFDSMARPAVPLFLMLSGAFMLAPEKPLNLRRLWFHYIPRLAGAYALWSVVYALYALTSAFTDFTGLTALSLAKAAVEGQYHLWYLPVIIMLYILLPILRPVIQGDGGRHRCEYMLAIFLAYGAVRATVLAFDFPGHSYAQALADRFTFGALWSYAGYFVLGYYLYRYTLSKAMKILLYSFGLIAAPLTAAATYLISVNTGAPDERFYTIFTVSTVCCSAALFVFFREIVSKINFSVAASHFIGFIASCSLGVYLIHVLILNLLADRAGINTVTLPSAVMIPALTAAVYIASLTFTALYKLIMRLLRNAAAHRKKVLTL